MQIIHTTPPLYAEILAAFPAANRAGVIFAWGDRIYMPSGGALTGPLAAHEAVHGERQLLQGVENWWRRYLACPRFRLEEEIPAHIAEVTAHAAEGHGRAARRAYLHLCAARLASPLYGSLVSVSRARALIDC